jgi:hypothetical protein
MGAGISNNTKYNLCAIGYVVHRWESQAHCWAIRIPNVKNIEFIKKNSEIM